jgi:DNA-binding beta-propeller fold protein YncE
MRRFRIQRLLALFLVIAIAGAASAQAQVFWTEASSSEPTPKVIKRADGNGGNVSTVTSTGSSPLHIAYDPEHGHIYWTEISGIRRVNEDGTFKVTVVNYLVPPFSSGRAAGIVYNPLDGRIYWADSLAGKLYRMFPEGGVPELLLSGLAGPNALALDAFGGLLYWVDGLGAIQRSATDGDELTTIVSGEGFLTTGLAIDTAGGKLYWGRHDLGIRRSSLSGASKETLVPLAVGGSPNGLAFDSVNNRLLWAEFASKIMTSGPDGSSPQVLVAGLSFPLGVVALGTVPVVSIFTDGFESGDTSAWSVTVTP